MFIRLVLLCLVGSVCNAAMIPEQYGRCTGLQEDQDEIIQELFAKDQVACNIIFTHGGKFVVVDLEAKTSQSSKQVVAKNLGITIDRVKKLRKFIIYRIPVGTYPDGYIKYLLQSSQNIKQILTLHKIEGRCVAQGMFLPFFRVQKDSKQGYLLGTSHLRMRLSCLPDIVLNAFAKSKTFLTEVPITIWSKLSVVEKDSLKRFFISSVAKGDVDLSSVAMPAALSDPLKELEIDIDLSQTSIAVFDLLQRIYPSCESFVSSVLSEQMDKYFDMLLFTKSVIDGKELVRLETNCSQLQQDGLGSRLSALKRISPKAIFDETLCDVLKSHFEKLSEKPQLDLKKVVFEQIDSLPLSRYLANIPQILIMISGIFNLPADSAAWLLSSRRNILWMQSILAHFAAQKLSETFFVAGGIAHMYRQGSIIDLLQNQDFTVDQYDFKRNEWIRLNSVPKSPFYGVFS